ncbi:probable methyltransferase-like protein 24 [Palaemon carinicauda]|uniref:probable methyltransferase-like protein 24 n=1 Tax=Palaemon carinicauda TaxID=392227 RepID=UPI0035B57E77
MLLRMTLVRIRVTPLAGYLVILAVYSGFMCISTFKEHQRRQFEAMAANEASDQADPLPKITRRSRSLDPPKFAAVDDFYSWLSSPETDCRKLLRFGGTYCQKTVDSDKNVCLDADVALKPKNCTVYSFGIGHDTSFDDMSNYFGCNVYMFDPSINKEDVSSQLLEKQKFFHIGLSSKNYTMLHNITYVDSHDKEVIEGKYSTYDKIRELVGHKNQPVHYLKVDIENTEWDVIPYLSKKGLFAGIMQIAIEVHTMTIMKIPPNRVMEELQRYARILLLLRKEGFQRVSYRPNYVEETLYKVPGENRSIPTCSEVLYIRRGPPLTDM